MRSHGKKKWYTYTISPACLINLDGLKQLNLFDVFKGGGFEKSMQFIYIKLRKWTVI